MVVEMLSKQRELSLREFKSELLDRGVQMGRCDMRTPLVQRGELLFEHSENVLRVRIARRGV